MSTTITEYWFLLILFIKDMNTTIAEYWSWLLVFIRDTSTTTIGYWSWVLVFIMVAGGFVHYIVLPTLRWVYLYGIKTLRELPVLVFNEVIWIIFALIRLVGPLAAVIWIAYSIKTKEYEFTVLAIIYGIACIKFYSHYQLSTVQKQELKK